MFYATNAINPATKLVIPAAAERRAGIQTRRWNYWIPAFTGMTGRWISVAILNCHVNNEEKFLVHQR
jgi:hypothetical protein